MSPRRITIGPRLRLLGPSALLMAAAGCAQSGPLTARYTTIGALKSDVVQLETEKSHLRREVKTLQAENRRLQDRIVEADQVNGELAARLDDARNAIRDQGGDPSIARPNFERDPSNRVRTAPAAQDRRKQRRSPVTQIPGIFPIPEADDDGFERDPEPAPPPRPRDRDDDQSRRDDAPWRPLARGPRPSGLR